MRHDWDKIDTLVFYTKILAFHSSAMGTTLGQGLIGRKEQIKWVVSRQERDGSWQPAPIEGIFAGV
jgi:squalene cyclase